MIRKLLVILSLSMVQVPHKSAAAESGGAYRSPGASAVVSRNEMSPRDIEAQFLVGLTQLEAGNPQRAIEIFSRILATYPSLVRVRLELGRAYFATQQWERARQEFFKTLSGDLPDPVRRTVLGFIRAIDARRGFD